MTWQMISDPGFGINQITYVPSMSFFKGELYVGASYVDSVARNRHAELWKCFPSRFMSPSYIRNHWTKVDLLSGSHGVESMTPFGDFLFVATSRRDVETDYIKLYRYRERGSSRTPLDPIFVRDGYIGDLVVFHGQLYALRSGTPLGIYRSDEPSSVDWEDVTGDVTTRTGSTNFSGIFATNGTHLYLGTRIETPGGGGGAQIWRSNNGSDWEIWISDGFGETSNGAIVSMSFFEGYLYAATQNHVEGSKVFRIDLSAPDTYVVSPHIIGESSPLRGSAVWRNHLYMGEGNNGDGARLFVKEANGEEPSPFELASSDFTPAFIEDPDADPPRWSSRRPLYLVPIISSRHPSEEGIFLAAFYQSNFGLIIWREADAGSRYVMDWIFNTRPIRWMFRNTRFIPWLFSPLWEVIQLFPSRQEPMNPPIDVNPGQ